MNVDEALAIVVLCRDSRSGDIPREAAWELAAAIERVRELHVPYTIGFCQACTKDWPCPTIEMLGGPS